MSTFSISRQYTGQYKDGRFHGHGTYAYSWGGKYVGQWQNGIKFGQGTYTDSGGKYAGQWKNGIRHQGTQTYSSGDKHVGQWENNKRNGHGTYTWSYGDKYIGEWKDDKMHGQGTYTDSDGNKYVGPWKKGERSGRGTLTLSNGDTFEGQFKDWERRGMRTITYSNGNTYIGQFKNGKSNGQGRYIYANGDYYIGQFKNWKRHGQGTLTYAKGNKHIGPLKKVQINPEESYTVSVDDDQVGYVGDVVLSGNDQRVGSVFTIFDTEFDTERKFGGDCSGTLIGKKYVLTAAHCMYDLKNHMWREGVKFYPGVNSKRMRGVSLRKYGWKRMFILKDFLKGTMTGERTIDNESIRGDIGLVELDEEVGDVGHDWFEFGYFKDLKSISAIQTTLVGYPGDKPKGSMWKSTCSDASYSKKDSMITMSCKVYPGSSGAALRADIDGKSDIIYAVNSAESTKNNYATFITSDIYKTINGWINGTYNTDTFVKDRTSYIENPKAAPSLYTLEFTNMCDKELNVFLRYETLEDGWKTVWYKNLEPYSNIRELQTKTATYYYYAKSDDDKYIIEGDGDNQYFTGKRNDSFVKAEKLNSSWGRWRNAITCENM